MANSKYPKSYNEENPKVPGSPFRPEFKHDSRGRLIIPLPGYSKMMLSVEPGSKTISQGTENETGAPQTDPGSLSTGYIYANSVIKVGPKGGWIAQMAGGDFEYPFSYFNETSKEMKFYLNKKGDIYIKGQIDAQEGGHIGGFIIKDKYLESATTPKSCGLAPYDWPFWAGASYEERASAPFRVDNSGKIWASSIELLDGSGVGNLAKKDTADYATDVSGTKPPSNADHTADIVGDMAYEDMVEKAKLGSTIVEGGYIKTELLTADNIRTGTLTGIHIQTDDGSSGHKQRIILENSRAKFYNTNGTLSAYIYGYLSGGHPGIRITAPGTNGRIWLDIPDDGVVEITVAGSRKAYFDHEGVLHLPEDGIGIGSGKRFGSIINYLDTPNSNDITMALYATNVGSYTHSTGLIFYQPQDSIGYIAPYSEESGNLGNPNNPGEKFKNLYLSASAYIDEDVNVNGGITLGGVYRTSWPSGGVSSLSDLSIDGNKNWQGYSITNIGYVEGSGSWNLRVDHHNGQISCGGNLIFDFYTNKVACKKPFGFESLSSPPGAASDYTGYMYWDTDRTDLVFSNGAQWIKVTATAYYD